MKNSKEKVGAKSLTMSKPDLVNLILERVESILLEQGLTANAPFSAPEEENVAADPFGQPSADPAMEDDIAPNNDSAEAEPLLSLEDLESMDQPDARKTLLAGLQGGGEEQKTTAELVAAILGKPSPDVATQEDLLPASPELQQTASDVASISGLSIQEQRALKQMFKSYLSEKKTSSRRS